jgi:hypothetical protein
MRQDTSPIMLRIWVSEALKTRASEVQCGAGLHICYEEPVGFLALYRRTPSHSGLVIIVPNLKPALQRQLFETALGLVVNEIWSTP